MRNIVGMNIQGDQGENEAHIVSVVERLNPHAVVVINNRKLAIQLMSKTDLLIYRIKTDQWNDDDADGYDARAFARALNAEAPPGALLYAGNEQGAHQGLVTWTDTFMDECEKMGRRACILNFSVGYPPDIHELDKFKPNFRRAAQKGHVFGSHDGYFNRHWNGQFIDRHIYLRDVLMQGEPFPEIVMTECGCVYDYQPHRGYRWGDWPLTDEQYAHELINLAKHYQPHGISMCVFVLSRDYEQNEWRHFIPRQRVYDVLQANPIEWKARTNMATISTPPVGHDPDSGFATKTTTGLNLRPTASTAGERIRVVPMGEAVTVYTTPLTAPDTNGRVWAYVKDAQGNTGYMPLYHTPPDGVSFNPPVLLPGPEPEPTDITITPAQLEALKGIRDAMDEWIKGVKPSTSGGGF